jgi:hypothetical protein
MMKHAITRLITNKITKHMSSLMAFCREGGILGNSNIDKREWGLAKEKSQDGTLCRHMPWHLMHSGKCLSASLLFICLFSSKILCLSCNNPAFASPK